MARRSAALLAFLIALVAAPAAHGATANVVNGTLTYIAAPGETNTVSIAFDPTIGYEITDSTAMPKGGTGCGSIGHEVDCEDQNITTIVVNLRDGNDKWTGGDIKITPAVDGGDGNDDLEGIGSLSGGAGDDILKGTDGGAQLDGGDGNDLVVGGQGDDILDGGPGDDLLIGNDGSDTLLGNTGLDRIDASGDGPKSVDCQGRDDEIIQGGENVTRTGCAPAPRAQISAAGVSVKRLLAGGMPFTVTCDRPCAVYWELTPTAKKVRKLIHHAGGWLDRHTTPVDGDGFYTFPSDPQKFTAHVLGNASKKALRRLTTFGVTLGVQVYGRDGLTSKVFKPLRIG
jgi:hypothetical protein